METGAVGFSRPKILNQVILGLFTLLSFHYLTGEPLSEEDKMKLAWASEMWITVELMKLLG